MERALAAPGEARSAVEHLEELAQVQAALAKDRVETDTYERRVGAAEAAVPPPRFRHDCRRESHCKT